VSASNPWVQWGGARAKWAAFLERGFSSYLNVSEKTLPRCSELGQSNTYTLRETALLQLVSDPRDMAFAHIEFAANGDVFVVGYSKTFAQVLPIFQHTWRKGMISSCC
jgi:hypothetical protein